MQEDIDSILKKAIQYVKGIGEARAKLFGRLNILNVEDMIMLFPRDYEDRSSLKKIAMLVDGEECTFQGMVLSKVSESRIRKGLTLYKTLVRDDSGSIAATWYNQHYIKSVFQVGETYMFYGKISRRFRNFEVQNPVYEKINGNDMKNTLRIIPIYPSTANLSQNVIRNAIENALQLVDSKLLDVLPAWMRDHYRLSEYNYSVQNIHFPKSDGDFKNARQRLVFEELLLLQLGLSSMKNVLSDVKKGIVFKPIEEASAEFIIKLPFQLTNAQKRVFSEIEIDMESDKVMNRLVQGDVGSGKTMVAVLALLKAVKSGYQGVLMVPTEILAEQHFKGLSGMFGEYGIQAALLTGSRTKKEKEKIQKDIQEGIIDIVIGTHALLEEGVVFDRLGLVITDEQHRFGVRQRTVLSQKGNNPDVLVMTATPIPRTLALILYGDLDISIIDELPPGRKNIKTYSVENGMRQRINEFIRKQVGNGRQVYIVCPLVEDSDEVEAKSAVELANRITTQDFRDLRVGLIHGKMKSRDKESIMHSFVSGEIDILVSTTVIEVGVNVPNANTMVIENAEHFGLSQLHQLRGRVGRGEHQSYCILYNEGKSHVSRERMQVMQDTCDGFVISEKDLELRGPGEFFGTRQHGLPELRIANLYSDVETLKQAQEAVQLLLQQDRNLEREEHTKLKGKMLARFSRKLQEISMN